MEACNVEMAMDSGQSGEGSGGRASFVKASVEKKGSGDSSGGANSADRPFRQAVFGRERDRVEERRQGENEEAPPIPVVAVPLVSDPIPAASGAASARGSQDMSADGFVRVGRKSGASRHRGSGSNPVANNSTVNRFEALQVVEGEQGTENGMEEDEVSSSAKNEVVPQAMEDADMFQRDQQPVESEGHEDGARKEGSNELVQSENTGRSHRASLLAIGAEGILERRREGEVSLREEEMWCDEEGSADKENLEGGELTKENRKMIKVPKLRAEARQSGRDSRENYSQQNRAKNPFWSNLTVLSQRNKNASLGHMVPFAGGILIHV
ncbi:hypothetical protein R1sor_003422 [Riccia sorocarpa]|uniref:Uncharacterized protein n=1 Tax=Riccia sorocarpa TaxID=122646 RepID=A0ABD3H4Y2_9MARC